MNAQCNALVDNDVEEEEEEEKREGGRGGDAHFIEMLPSKLAPL